MCAAQVPGRHLPQPADPPDVLGADLQAHPGAGLAADLHLRREAFQVVVNGYTGRMAGEYPKSAWKIALLVLLAIIAC